MTTQQLASRTPASLRLTPVLNTRRMDLDPESWSKLPLELITLIILATDDPGTLRCWRLATKDNRRLNFAVLRSQWRDTTIDEWDLVPAPGKDTKEAGYKARKLRKGACPQKECALLDGVINERALSERVLEYIERLSLSFLFWYTRDYRFRELEDSDYLLPSGETLEISLARLSPKLGRLRHVALEGRVVQAMVDMITSIPATSQIKSLRINRCKVFGWFMYLNFPKKGPATIELLDLQSLRQMTMLQHLEVRDLKIREAKGLASAVSHLAMLQSLAVQAAYESGSSSCVPFIEFLINARAIGDPGELGTSAFPPTLRSLELLDQQGPLVSYSQTEHDALSRICGSSISCPNLKNIALNFKNPFLTSTFLRKLGLIELHTLAVCGSSYGCFHRDEPELRLSMEYDLYYHILLPFARTLQKVRLTAAWNVHPYIDENLTPPRRNCLFSIQELTLGTRIPSFYAFLPPGISGCCTLWRCLFGHSIASEVSWGLELRRLRIDHITVDELEAGAEWVDVANRPTEPLFSRVKVLMLRPGPARSRRAILTGVQPPSTREPDTNVPRADRLDPQHEVLRTVDTDHGLALAARLVPLLVAAGFSALRVLVVGDAHVWVERPCETPAAEGEGKPGPVAWSLGAAMRDAEQGPLVDCLVTARDWEFLEDESVPRMEERAKSMSWMQGASSFSDPIAPEAWMLDCWNVVGILPTTEQEAEDEEEEKEAAAGEEEEDAGAEELKCK